MEILMSVSELLEPLATLDEVSVVLPGSTDHDHGHVPPWCEVLLEVKRVDDGTLKPAWPINARLPLRRHDGELIMEALHEALHPYADDAVANIWAELDDVVDRIQARVEKGKEPMKADRGQALGLAVALAHLLGCEVDEVREQAMERYSER
jgi:hypothetical protein